MALLRVGHKGADAIVPGNTTESFAEALRCGVDVIEFDVIREIGTGRLVLAHDPHDASTREVQTLEEAVGWFAATSGVELDVDLKAPGYELPVLEALRGAGLVERTLVSSQFRESLALLRDAEPALRLGWSVPKLRRDPFRSRVILVPVMGAMAVYREVLPRWAAAEIRSGAVDALMAHWRLVTRRLIRAVHGAGGLLYVWTVDDPAQIARLERLGVDAVITNDPRLLQGSLEAA
jgi:glycerophosphoryl diester phosphodiesterase